MPYKRTLRGSVVWQASYYVPNDLLPPEARKGSKKTRIYERASEAGYPNTQAGAKSLENRRRREVRDGSYSYRTQGRYTASSWLREWTEMRNTRNKHADKRSLELHFLPFRDFMTRPLVDYRPRDIQDWLRSGRERVDHKEISAKTLRNVYGVAHTMFHDAVVRELIAVNPCVVSRGDLPAKQSKQGRRYQEEESANLAWEPCLPADVRVLFSMLTFTGERVGEAVGHRWLDLDRDTRPLWALTLENQYDGEPLKTSTDKERPRCIPVHDELRRVLTWWHDVGFEVFYGRRPLPTDPIIPNFFKRGHHTKKSIYHRSRDAFEAAGIFWRAHHACRHAFITACRRRNANSLWLERITHNAEGTILDTYTDTIWEPLCEVVTLLPWTVHDVLSESVATDMATREGSEASGSCDSGAGEGIRNLLPNRKYAGKGENGDSGDTPNSTGNVGSGIVGARRRQTGSFHTGPSPEELRAAAQARTARLEVLAELDPTARPGLAVCRAMEAAYEGNLDEVERRLAEALDALEGEPEPVADARIGGAR